MNIYVFTVIDLSSRYFSFAS